MKLSIYRIEAGGNYLLLPVCFLPPESSTDRYGAMRMCRQVDATDALSQQTWEHVVEDIERDGFAVLDTQRAHELVSAACLEPVPQHSTVEAAAAFES